MNHPGPPHHGLAAHGAPHHVRPSSRKPRHERTSGIRIRVTGRRFVEHHVLRPAGGDGEGLPPLPSRGVAEPVPGLHLDDQRFARHSGGNAGAVDLGTFQTRDAGTRCGLAGHHHDVERGPCDRFAAVPGPHLQRVTPRDPGFEPHFARAVAGFHGFNLGGSYSRHLHSERK